MFYAGAFKVDITPPLGTMINGDFVPHYARTIHDPLYAKALVIRGDDVTVGIVVVDIAAMAKEFIDDVKGLIKERTGIDPANMMVASTHTHAAGSIEGLLLSEADLAYRRELPGLIVDAVAVALERLRPAKVGFGFVDVPEHVVCRRYYMKEGYVARNPVTGGTDRVKTNPVGDESQIDRRVSTMDTEVGFVAVKGTDDKWISVLANYSMHYAGDWENGTITADYFGVFSRHIQQKISADEDFVGMMSNGTSGEANIWDFLDPDRYPREFFGKSELIGKDIAEKVAHSLGEVEWQTDPVVRVSYKEIEVAVRKPSAYELEAAKKTVASTSYAEIRDIDSEALRKIYAREQVLLNAYPDSKKLPLQVIRIGNGMIGGLGGEFFAETGLWLKENTPMTTYFTICFANDYVGYVPPQHEIEQGGYETWRCRTSHLEAGAERRIREALRGEVVNVLNP
jgi:hypothetical protein